MRSSFCSSNFLRRSQLVTRALVTTAHLDPNSWHMASRAFCVLPTRSYMIESPRWLATSGRLAECAKYLTTIARVNGRADIEITESYLKKMLPDTDAAANGSSGGSSESPGLLSFFTNWRIARNTFLLVFCW